MTREQQPPFRLTDLPGEIRTMVYKEVLCSVAPTPSPLDVTPLARISQLEPKPKGVCHVAHPIETALLQTCKEVHREAYDVMVKTNRFIRIRAHNYELLDLLLKSQLPVIARNRENVDRFPGYVLQIEIVKPGIFHSEKPGSPYDIMILGRDLDTFCRALGNENIRKDNTHIHITLNPWPCFQRDYKAPITKFFSAKTQQALLAPFRTHLHQVYNIKISGSVSPELAQAVVEEVRSTFFVEFDELFSASLEALERAEQLLARGNSIEASLELNTALRALDRHPSSFVIRAPQETRVTGKLSELAFHLNSCYARCYIQQLRTIPDSAGLEILRELERGTATYFERALRFLDRFEGDPAHIIPAWMPPASTLASMSLQHATFFRLYYQARNRMMVYKNRFEILGPQRSVLFIKKLYRQLAVLSRDARTVCASPPELLADIEAEIRELDAWKLMLLAPPPEAGNRAGKGAARRV